MFPTPPKIQQCNLNSRATPETLQLVVQYNNHNVFRPWDLAREKKTLKSPFWQDSLLPGRNYVVPIVQIASFPSSSSTYWLLENPAIYIMRPPSGPEGGGREPLLNNHHHQPADRRVTLIKASSDWNPLLALLLSQERASCSARLWEPLPPHGLHHGHLQAEDQAAEEHLLQAVHPAGEQDREKNNIRS